jgi:hypothetical protein
VTDVETRLAALALASPTTVQPAPAVRSCSDDSTGNAQDATAISKELARLAISETAGAAAAEQPAELPVNTPAQSGTIHAELDQTLASGGWTTAGGASPPQAIAHPANARPVQRRPGRSGHAAQRTGQENQDMANRAHSAAQEDSAGKASRAQRRRTSQDPAALESAATDAAPERAAPAKRVTAMRQFWETAALKEGRPKPGSRGLPHKGRGAATQQPPRKQASASVQEWSDDD